MNSDQEDYAQLEARAEWHYAEMYEAARHHVKDHYDDAMLCFAHASEAAEKAGRGDEAERIRKRSEDVRAVYNNQFRWL